MSRNRHRTRLTGLAPLAALLLLGACADQTTDPAGVGARLQAAAPIGLVSLWTTTGEVVLWPFTGTDVAGSAADPVNLVFAGQADPRQVRAALLALDGDRTAFGMPAAFPFDCRWSDTPSGGVQTTYTDSAGWQGGAIQLQCGDYAPVRFHLRLFRHRGVTLGGAHFEVLISGTSTHEVLSWELAEQLVTVDMVRSGLLGAAPAPSGSLYPAPTYRAINMHVWNGLPAELQYLATGTPGPAAADVPIPSDGNATLFFLYVAPTVTPGVTNRTFTLAFDQVIPKPFCGSPADYVHVSGPVTLTETATQDAGGDYTSAFQATGRLTVVPVNPLTGAPAGEPYEAEVKETHLSALTDGFQRASSHLVQIQLPVGVSGHGRLDVRLLVDSRGSARDDVSLQCTP